jgi:flagellar basal body-associated protein FliL
VNLLGDNIDTIRKNTGTLIDASKEVGILLLLLLLIFVVVVVVVVVVFILTASRFVPSGIGTTIKHSTQGTHHKITAPSKKAQHIKLHKQRRTHSKYNATTILAITIFSNLIHTRI